MRHAPELFLGAYIPALNGRTLVGIVCATVASSEHLTLKSMDEHIPSGTTVCIHTVCVSPTHRKKGIALSLLQEYIARLKRACRSGALYERVTLITHKHLIPFYKKAELDCFGRSDVVLGPEQWYEMGAPLAAAATTAKTLRAAIASHIAPPPYRPHLSSAQRSPSHSQFAGESFGYSDIVISEETRTRVDVPLRSLEACGGIDPQTGADMDNVRKKSESHLSTLVIGECSTA